MERVTCLEEVKVYTGERKTLTLKKFASRKSSESAKLARASVQLALNLQSLHGSS